MNKIVSILFLLVIFLANGVCLAQASELVVTDFSAAGSGKDIYYLTIDRGSVDSGFSVYYADSSEPAKCYYLDSYKGRPLVTTIYNGHAVVFFDNGTVLGYSLSGGITCQNFDKSYKPLDAVVYNSQLYLLTAGVDDTVLKHNYTVFKLDGSEWATVAVVSTGTPLADSQIFFYDDGLYLAGTDQQGELFCDIIWSEDNHGREINVSELKQSRLIDVLTANRSVVFILAQGASQQVEYYTAVFASNQLSSGSKLDMTELPELLAGKFTFLSCGLDIALAVYDDNKIMVQKYDVKGAKVGATGVSYQLDVSDISENVYVQAVAFLGPALIVITIIIRFKKTMAICQVPANACGLPAPLFMRAPAFAVDLIIVLFIVEIAMKVLGGLSVIDLELWQHTMENMPNPFETAGKVNIDIQVLAVFYLLLYLVMILYFTVFEWLLFATPGKLIFGLKVVDVATLVPVRLSFWRILLRNIYRVPESVPHVFPLVLVLMIVSPGRQRCGDMVAKTTVIMGRAIKKNGTNIDKIA